MVGKMSGIVVSVYQSMLFAVRMTVHRDYFLVIKPTICTNFSNLFLE